MPPIFCIISLGRKRGKTTLIEWLLKKLSERGISAASIKHSREGFDARDKDTWRHLEAGSLEVVYVSPSELVSIRRTSASIEDALEAFHIEPDVILVEGFKEAPYPKILCASDLSEVEEAAKKLRNVIAATGEITLKDVQEISEIKVVTREEILRIIEDAVRKSWINRIPGLNCGKCSYGSCAALARAIEEGRATIRDCVMRSFIAARLVIDGEEVPLGTWPQKLLRELLKAFVKSLKLKDLDVESARKILLEVRLQDLE